LNEDQNSQINCGESFKKVKARSVFVQNKLVSKSLEVFDKSKLVDIWDEDEVEFKLPDGSVPCSQSTSPNRKSPQ